MINQKLKEIRRLENQFFSIVLKSRARAMYAMGEISDELLGNKNEFIKTVVRDLSNGRKENLIIDHRETLKKHSEDFQKKDQIHISKVFLATQVEHTLNAIIVYYCEQNRLSKKTAKEIIRSTGLSHKTGWLLKVFNYPEIPKEHIKIITKLAEERNSFLHYKWTPLDHGFMPPENDFKENELSLNEILPTIDYMMKYEENLRFNGNLEIINQIFQDIDMLNLQQLVEPETYKELYNRFRERSF